MEGNKTKKPLKNAKINTCRWWKIRNGGGLGGFPNHKREYFPAQHAFRRWCVPLFLETISLASGRYTIHIPQIYIDIYREHTRGGTHRRMADRIQSFHGAWPGLTCPNQQKIRNKNVDNFYDSVRTTQVDIPLLFLH